MILTVMVVTVAMAVMVATAVTVVIRHMATDIHHTVMVMVTAMVVMIMEQIIITRINLRAMTRFRLLLQLLLVMATA